MLREIELQQNKFLDVEEKQLKRILQEERGFYSTVASSLGLLIRKELNIFGMNLNISQELLKLDTVLDASNDDEDSDDSGEVDDISDHGFVFLDPDLRKNKSSLMRSLSGSVLSLTSTKDRELKKEMKKSNILFDIAENSSFFEEEEEEGSQGTSEDKENVQLTSPAPIHLLGEERFLLARRNSFMSPRHDRRAISMRSEVYEENVERTILIQRPRERSVSDTDSLAITNIDDHLKLIEDQNNKILSNMDDSVKLDNLLNIGLGYL